MPDVPAEVANEILAPNSFRKPHQLHIDSGGKPLYNANHFGSAPSLSVNYVNLSL